MMFGSPEYTKFIKDYPPTNWNTPVEAFSDRIVCAANLVNNHIVCGVRHYDQIMVDMMDCIDEAYSGANVEQGFVNQRGEFLTREEAWIVALAAGQVIRRVGGNGKKLFSENIY